jgi:hypothetical protein
MTNCPVDMMRPSLIHSGVAPRKTTPPSTNTTNATAHEMVLSIHPVYRSKMNIDLPPHTATNVLRIVPISTISLSMMSPGFRNSGGLRA